MAQVLNHLALLAAARMIGHQGLTTKEADVEWISLERQTLVGILDRHGVVVGLEAHPSGRMHQHFHQRIEFGRMGWQRSQIRALKREARSNGIGPPSHDALLIAETIGAQVRVNGFQVSALGKGYEVVSARIPNQIFDTAFLPPSMHIGKERDLRDRHCGNAESARARAGYVLAGPGARRV